MTKIVNPYREGSEGGQKSKLTPGPFYDPNTIYSRPRRDEDEWEPVPDWIAFGILGAFTAFTGIVCFACWFAIHHRGGH